MIKPTRIKDEKCRRSLQCLGPGQFVVVAVFRYCLGRQTYVVQECVDWLLLHWPSIDQPVRNLIRSELDRAFEQDDAARASHDASGYKPLGWDCDREQWQRVRSMWANAEVTGIGRNRSNDD